MDRRVESLEVVATESAFFRDDQAAIRAGAARNGFLYDGAPLTPGFTRIREPGLALTILLRLDDGHVVTGDCAEVQYAGAGGRGAPLDAVRGTELVAGVAAPALVGQEVGDFRALSCALRPLGLPAWLRYGLSQALLRGAAYARAQPMAQVVCEQWELPMPTTLVPVLAQSGDSPREAADRMILKRVDALPHGLINNVETRLGANGELLHDLVAWLRDRVLELAGEESYRPILQFDVYGTIGLAFGTTSRMADYLERLAVAARPFALRIEHPVDAGGREAQIEALGALRRELRSVELIADEWCNTIEDVQAFAAAGCVDMIQVKTPDLGGLDETIDALLVCKRHGIKAYCGGTCNETVGSAEVTAHVALATGSDLTLAKPGMGVDEGLSVTRNAMRVALARMRA